MYRHHEYYYEIPCRECNLNYFSVAHVLTVKHVIEDGSKKDKALLRSRYLPHGYRCVEAQDVTGCTVKPIQSKSTFFFFCLLSIFFKYKFTVSQNCFIFIKICSLVKPSYSTLRSIYTILFVIYYKSQRVNA